ncbi:hypothetical protein JCM5296_004905 [Sporobolomyces johnsonii]
MPKFTPRDPQSRTNKPYTKPNYRPDRPPRPSDPHPASSSSARPPHFNRNGPPPRPQADRPPRFGPPQSKGKAKAKDQPESLDLTGQILTEPPRLSDFAFLGRLNLTDCGLTTLSFVKEARRTLTWLNVSGNNLRAPEAWEGIGELKGLYVLNASHSGLTEVPRCVASLTSLKALVLSHNSIKTLEHIGSLPDLNTIVVSNNSLTSLPSSLATLPSLKKISAAHNQLTSPGLPDLSALPALHELRLNDNRTLTSLPPHFGSWGKAPLPAGERDTKRRQGLEILDLGNCGFDSWFGLRALAQQDGIVNLGLKGNKVAEEAMQAGFDDFKSKITILLPSLRILDNVRFDAKHLDLKTKRSSRTAEQAILDAGPMALALNAKKENPVEISAEALKERERERENRRRRKLGLPELGDGRRKEKREKEAEEQRGEEKAEAEGEGEGADAEEKSAPAPSKEKKRQRDDQATPTPAPVAVADVDVDSTAPGAEPARKKKKKNRHEARRLAEGESADAEPAKPTASTDTAPTTKSKKPSAASSSSSSDKPAPAPKQPPVTATDTSSSASKPKDPKRPKKKKGGLLDALRADPDSDGAVPSPSPAASAKPAPTPAPAPAEPQPQPDEKPDKQKTSVLRVVEVRKSDKGATRKGASAAAKGEGGEGTKPQVDVGELLGLGKKNEGAESGAVGGALGGSGWFGGGGWD